MKSDQRHFLSALYSAISENSSITQNPTTLVNKNKLFYKLEGKKMQFNNHSAASHTEIGQLSSVKLVTARP